MSDAMNRDLTNGAPVASQDAALIAENATLRRCGEDMSEGLGKLEAENARLRADIKTAYESRDRAVERANQLEWHTLPDMDAENARLRAEVGQWQRAAQALRLDGDRAAADLTRVTDERDALRGSARLVVNTVGNMTQAQLGHEGYAAVCGLIGTLDFND